MDIKEFRDRTKTYTPIVSYEAQYEPAYMELDCLDKDDFCEALQNEVVRRIVTGFSRYILTSRVKLQKATQDLKDLTETVGSLTNQNDNLRKKLSLIHTLCDKALPK